MVRRLRYWTVMVHLAHRGMALALSLLVLLLVLLPAASPARALCTVQRQRAESCVPLLFVFTQEDESDQESPASLWPYSPTLINETNHLERILSARRWSIGRAARARTIQIVSTLSERAPPA